MRPIRILNLALPALPAPTAFQETRLPAGLMAATAEVHRQSQLHPDSSPLAQQPQLPVPGEMVEMVARAWTVLTVMKVPMAVTVDAAAMAASRLPFRLQILKLPLLLQPQGRWPVREGMEVSAVGRRETVSLVREEMAATEATPAPRQPARAHGPALPRPPPLRLVVSAGPQRAQM